jgi:hypothetical protein
MNESNYVGGLTAMPTDKNNSEFETALDQLREEVLAYTSNVDKAVSMVWKLKPITENPPQEQPIPSGEGLLYRLGLEIMSLQQLNNKLRLLNAHMEKIVG